MSDHLSGMTRKIHENVEFLWSQADVVPISNLHAMSLQVDVKIADLDEL